MKRNRVLSLILAVVLVASVSGAIIVFGAPLSITLDGVNAGWVGKDGVKITADDNGTKQPVDYKVSTNVNDDYNNLVNNIAVADNTSITLSEGSNQFIYAKSGSLEKCFGPLNVDLVDPAIVLSQDLTNFSYIVTEANFDYSASGYVFSSDATAPATYASKFTSLQGTLYNTASYKYLHIKLVDKAGNTTTQTSILNTGSLVDFLNYTNDGYALMTFGANVNLAKTTYYVKSTATTYETKSVTTRESKVWFPTTGTYTIVANVTLNDGRSTTVTSEVMTVSKVDTVGPTISIDSYRKGSSVTLTDAGAGVDTARSYVKSLGDTLYFKTYNQMDIDYTNPTVELVQVVAYDKAGNSTTAVFVNKYLEENIPVDISYEYRTYYLMAYGYTPSTNLTLDTDKLYYTYSGSKAVTFQKSGMKDIKFYIDTTITTEELVIFDVFDSKEISWSVKNSQNWDIENSFYQRNGKGAQKILKKNQYVAREDFDADLNFVRVTLVDWNGNEKVVESRYFPTTYQNAPASGSTDSNSNGTNTNNSNSGGLRTDGLKFRNGFFQYISGYPNGNFGPANPITRAEFAQILSSITEGGTVKSVSFTDVNPSSWYAPAVLRMAGLSVAFTNDSYFRPEDDITRAEAAAWLARLNLNPQIQQPAVFTDIEGHPLYNDIIDATQKGLIYGYTDGSFKPDYRISRVEAVAIINRALGRASDGTSVLSGAKLPPDMKSTDWGYYDVVDAMNTHTVGSTRSTTGYKQWTSLGN